MSFRLRGRAAFLISSVSGHHKSLLLHCCTDKSKSNNSYSSDLHCSCHRFCRACPPFPFPEKVALSIPQCEPFVKWILNFFATNPAFFVKPDVLSDLPRVIAGANSRLSTRGSFPSPALLPRKNPILPLDIYRKTWYTLPVAAPDGRVPSHRKAAVRGKSGHHRAG